MKAFQLSGWNIKKILRCSLSVAILMSFSSVSAYATVAEPDTSLAGAGWVRIEYVSPTFGDGQPNNQNNNVYSAKVNPDNSFSVLGTTSVRTQQCSSPDWCWTVEQVVASIANIRENGTLNNVVTTDAQFIVHGAFTPYGNKVLLLANTVPGVTGTIKRYNLDGTIDTGFADQGVFRDPNSLLSTFYPGLWQDSEGRILVASFPNGLARLLPSGVLDSTFGSDGATGSVGGNISSVVEAKDGAYYVMISGNTSPGARLHRYTEAGMLDTEFGTEGELALPTNTSAAQMLAMPDGGVLLLTGSLQTNQSYNARLTHFNSQGDIVAQTEPLSEPSVRYSNFLGLERGASLTRMPDGKILLSINRQGAVPVTWSIASMRLFGLFNPDLTPDIGFDGDNGLYLAEEEGKTIWAFDNTLPLKVTQTVDPKRRIVLVGASINETGHNKWTVARLMGDFNGMTPPPPPPNQSTRQRGTGMPAWLFLKQD
ncbi:hypothetical protein [Nitrincola tibetensis]|nr:hypothetical protein [Nitrincola tibetensis]